MRELEPPRHPRPISHNQVASPMPDAAPTPCRKPGCSRACYGGYCPAHTGYGAAAKKKYNQVRGSAASRGYGYRWRTKTQPRILRRDPFCKCRDASCLTCRGRGCLRASTEADHVVPRPRGSDDDGNLQGLCHDCHSHKTAREDGGFGRAPCGA